MRIADLDELEVLADIMNVEVEGITRRLYKGHKCFIIAKENNIIGFSWVNFSDISINGQKYLSFTDKSNACIYDLFICKKYENLDANSTLLGFVLEYLRKSSYLNVYTLMDKHNKLSLAEADNLGLKLESCVKVSKLIYNKEVSIKKIVNP